MSKKRHYKKRKKNQGQVKRWVIIILSVMMIAGIVKYTSSQIYPFVMSYAKNHLTNIATLVIKQSIAESDIVTFDMKEAIMFDENEKGEVSNIIVNTPLINHLLVTTSQNIEEKLLYVEEGRFSELGITFLDDGPLKDGVSLEVPLLAAFNLAVSQDVGPQIPVHIDVIGNTETDIVTNVKTYGINNALLEILLDIKVKMQVQLPFQSELLSVNVHSPLIVKLITGPIPEYYYIGNSSASPFTPMPENESAPNPSPELDTSEGLENLLMD